jgi:RNA polymerase sigma-70 factor (ECF subfamily)
VTQPGQPDSRTDHALLEAVGGGDVSAFEVLYYRHRDWVARLARRFTGDSHLALDVLQDTFAYLLRKLPGLRLTASLRTFLYPAVRHLAMERRRQATRYVLGDGCLSDVEAPVVPDGGARAELAAVMAALSADHREVVLLRFVDGLSLDEIAGALGIPVGTVKSRLHVALRTLRTDERTKRYFAE